MQIIMFGCRNKGFADGKVAELEKRHGIEDRTVKLGYKEDGHEVSGELQGWGCGFRKLHWYTVWRQGVGYNSVMCITCRRWVHKRCRAQVDWRTIRGSPLQDLFCSENDVEKGWHWTRCEGGVSTRNLYGWHIIASGGRVWRRQLELYRMKMCLG